MRQVENIRYYDMGDFSSDTDNITIDTDYSIAVLYLSPPRNKFGLTINNTAIDATKYHKYKIIVDMNVGVNQKIRWDKNGNVYKFKLSQGITICESDDKQSFELILPYAGTSDSNTSKYHFEIETLDGDTNLVICNICEDRGIYYNYG